MKRWLLLAAMLFAPALCWAQNTTVTATVTDPNGVAYAFGTGYAALVCPGNQAPTYNGYTVPRSFAITGLDGTGTFTQMLYDVNLILPTGCGYQWHLTAQNGITTFITGSITSVTGASINESTSISAYAVLLPGSSSALDLQSKSVPTNFGSAIGTTNIVGQTTSTGLYGLQAYYFVNTLGVNCSSATNSMAVTILWTDPLGNAQSSSGVVDISLSFTGNGTVNTYAYGYVNIAVKSGTAITYSVASTLASTGCTTTPQYQIYFRATN